LFTTWDWDCNTFLDSYADYDLAVHSTGAGGAAPTGAGPALQGPAPPVAEDPKLDVMVTPGQGLPAQVMQGAVTEEKIEYRDENGNLLDEAQVKALEGEVSFSTRYETRTRVVDAQGRDIYNEVVPPEEGQGVAGTLAEAPEPVTGGGEGEASAMPPRVDVEGD
ncbi:Dolichyl-phosphate-mannose--protein mannosyltransferase 1, partial [Teratosphaeriaceae sp. CCFEE 6253]